MTTSHSLEVAELSLIQSRAQAKQRLRDGDTQAQKWADLLRSGAEFTRVRRGKSNHKKIIFVHCSAALTTFYWESRLPSKDTKTSSKSHFRPSCNIMQIIEGRKSRSFQKYDRDFAARSPAFASGSELGELSPSLSALKSSDAHGVDISRSLSDISDRSLSIEFKEESSSRKRDRAFLTLDLEAPTVEIRNQWINALNWLIELMVKAQLGVPFNVQHLTHVDSDFQWSGQNLEDTFEFSVKLGEGAFGAVYLARHLKTNFEVAVKTIKEDKKEELEEVRHEIQMLRELRHPSIVAYYGCWGPDSSQRLWILMHYCKLGSINSVISRSVAPPSEDVIGYVMYSTLCALVYLHSKNIIHRDIKGENIFLTENAGVKLGDFGVSERMNIPKGDPNQTSEHHTSTIAGSPLWIAPEVVDGWSSFKADVWSTGITAIEIAEGELPNQHIRIPFHILAAIRASPAPRLSNKWSPQFQDFVAQALNKDPEQRPSALTLLQHPFIVASQSPAPLKAFIDQTPSKSDCVESQRLEASEKKKKQRTLATLSRSMRNFFSRKRRPKPKDGESSDGHSSTSFGGMATFGSDSAIELEERGHSSRSSDRSSSTTGPKPKSRYEMRLENIAREASDDHVKSDAQINEEYQTMVFDEGAMNDEAQREFSNQMDAPEKNESFASFIVHSETAGDFFPADEDAARRASCDPIEQSSDVFLHCPLDRFTAICESVGMDSTMMTSLLRALELAELSPDEMTRGMAHLSHLYGDALNSSQVDGDQSSSVDAVSKSPPLKNSSVLPDMQRDGFSNENDQRVGNRNSNDSKMEQSASPSASPGHSQQTHVDHDLKGLSTQAPRPTTRTRRVLSAPLDLATVSLSTGSDSGSKSALRRSPMFKSEGFASKSSTSISSASSMSSRASSVDLEVASTPTSQRSSPELSHSNGIAASVSSDKEPVPSSEDTRVPSSPSSSLAASDDASPLSPRSSAQERMSRLSRSVPTTSASESEVPTAFSHSRRGRGHSRAHTAFALPASNSASPTVDSTPATPTRQDVTSSYPPLPRPPLSASRVSQRKREGRHRRNRSSPLAPVSFDLDELHAGDLKSTPQRKQRARRRRRRSGSAQPVSGTKTQVGAQKALQQDGNNSKSNQRPSENSTSRNIQATKKSRGRSSSQPQSQYNSSDSSESSISKQSHHKRLPLNTRSQQSRSSLPASRSRTKQHSKDGDSRRTNHIRNRDKLNDGVPPPIPEPDLVNVSLTVNENGKVQVHIVPPGTPLYVPRSPRAQRPRTPRRSASSSTPTSDDPDDVTPTITPLLRTRSEISRSPSLLSRSDLHPTVSSEVALSYNGKHRLLFNATPPRSFRRQRSTTPQPASVFSTPQPKMRSASVFLRSPQPRYSPTPTASTPSTSRVTGFVDTTPKSARSDVTVSSFPDLSAISDTQQTSSSVPAPSGSKPMVSMSALLPTRSPMALMRSPNLRPPNHRSSNYRLSPISTRRTRIAVMDSDPERDELAAFAEHLSQTFVGDEDLAYLVPIDPCSNAICFKLQDGRLLAKYINVCSPNTVDERSVNKDHPLQLLQVIENQNLVIASAQSLGIPTADITPDVLIRAAQHTALVRNLLWHLIKVELVDQVTFANFPALIKVRLPNEDIRSLTSRPSSFLLLRWFNFILNTSDDPQSRSIRVSSFHNDLADSIAYVFLLKQLIVSDKTKSSGGIVEHIQELDAILTTMDVLARAEKLLRFCRTLGIYVILPPCAISSGNNRLNLCLTASIFRWKNGFDTITAEDRALLADGARKPTLPRRSRSLLGDRNRSAQGSSARPRAQSSVPADGVDSGWKFSRSDGEERTFRVWVNTLDLDSVYVHDLYYDLSDGIVLLKILEHVHPKCVDWYRVDKRIKNKFQKLANCNYAIEVGRSLNFRIPNVGGMDIVEGNRGCVKTFLWLILRSWIMSRLGDLLRQSPMPVAIGKRDLTERDVLKWANDAAGRKAANDCNQQIIRSFKDQSLSDSVFFLEVLHSIDSNIVDWDCVHRVPSNREQCLGNGRYAISLTRKLGATVLIVAEDIVSVRPNLMFLFMSSIITLFLGQNCTVQANDAP